MRQGSPHLASSSRRSCRIVSPTRPRSRLMPSVYIRSISFSETSVLVCRICSRVLCRGRTMTPQLLDPSVIPPDQQWWVACRGDVHLHVIEVEMNVEHRYENRFLHTLAENHLVQGQRGASRAEQPSCGYSLSRTASPVASRIRPSSPMRRRDRMHPQYRRRYCPHPPPPRRKYPPDVPRRLVERSEMHLVRDRKMPWQ